MQPEEIALIISSLMLLLFIIALVLSKKFLQFKEEATKQKHKEESINTILGKYFDEESAKEAKETLKAIEQMKKEIQKDINKTSKTRTKKAEKVMKSISAESEVIEHAGKVYTSFSIGLQSAMPRSESERKKDISDLMDAVKALEGYDQDYYSKEAEADDMGRGMFFDRITTKLGRAMRKEQLHKVPILVFDKLVYLGLKTIKKITRKDLQNSLKYMKDVGYIKDYIEINPQLILISQMDDKIRLTNPEKVVLAFAQDEDILTLNRLIEKTKWTEDYAKKIINGLVRKDLVDFSDNVINPHGFETAEEKQMRLELEKQIEDELKAKEKTRREEQHKLEEDFRKKQEELLKKKQEEEERKRLEEERKQKEEAERKAKERMKQAESLAKSQRKKFKKPSVKVLPLPKALPEKGENTAGASKTGAKSIKLIKADVKVPKPASKADLTEEEIVGVSDDLKKSIKEFQDLEKEIEKEEITEKPAEQLPEKPVEQVPEKPAEQVPKEKAFDAEQNLKDAMSELDSFLDIGGESEAPPPSTGDSDLDNLTFDDIDTSQYVGDDFDEELSDEAIIDGILSIYEKYEHINGGLFDTRLILQLIRELYVDITLEEVESVKDKLLDMGLVKDTLVLGGFNIWLFKFDSKQLDDNDRKLIESVLKNGWQDKTQLMASLGWDEELTLKTMKHLQDLEVLRLDEKNRAILPGLFVVNQ